jgi:HNH endonuclease
MTYEGKTFTVDESKRSQLQSKTFRFVNPDVDIYPHFCGISLLDALYNNSKDNVSFEFENGDPTDLRRCNVKKYHVAHKLVVQNYNVFEYIPGHYFRVGSYANKMKNPIWRVTEKDGGSDEFLLMYCEPEKFVKLCNESYQKILDFEKEKKNGQKFTWFVFSNGYAFTSAVDLYMHQVIMNCYGNGKGTNTTSVDHIDRDKLNNRLSNLRLATMIEQQQNTSGIIEGTKRKRKENAIPLPDGLKQSDLPKYVVYYKDEREQREFFKVEKHPNQGQRLDDDGVLRDVVWTSSKSGKVSIRDKLAAAVKVVQDLDANIQPTKIARKLPKYYSIVNTRGKDHMVFEKRDEGSGKRLNLKMVLPTVYDVDEQVELLQEKVKAKYPDLE